MRKQYRGPEAEIWALGCCLYIMLTGVVPFSSADHAINSSYAIPCRSISSSCIDLLDNMLQKDFKKRISIANVQKHAWCLNSFANNV